MRPYHSNHTNNLRGFEPIQQSGVSTSLLIFTALSKFFGNKFTQPSRSLLEKEPHDKTKTKLVIRGVHREKAGPFKIPEIDFLNAYEYSSWSQFEEALTPKKGRFNEVYIYAHGSINIPRALTSFLEPSPTTGIINNPWDPGYRFGNLIIGYPFPVFGYPIENVAAAINRDNPHPPKIMRFTSCFIGNGVDNLSEGNSYYSQALNEALQEGQFLYLYGGDSLTTGDRGIHNSINQNILLKEKEGEVKDFAILMREPQEMYIVTKTNEDLDVFFYHPSIEKIQQLGNGEDTLEEKVKLFLYQTLGQLRDFRQRSFIEGLMPEQEEQALEKFSPKNTRRFPGPTPEQMIELLSQREIYRFLYKIIESDDTKSHDQVVKFFGLRKDENSHQKNREFLKENPDIAARMLICAIADGEKFLAKDLRQMGVKVVPKEYNKDFADFISNNMRDIISTWGSSASDLKELKALLQPSDIDLQRQVQNSAIKAAVMTHKLETVDMILELGLVDLNKKHFNSGTHSITEWLSLEIIAPSKTSPEWIEENKLLLRSFLLAGAEYDINEFRGSKNIEEAVEKIEELKESSKPAASHDEKEEVPKSTTSKRNLGIGAALGIAAVGAVVAASSCAKPLVNQPKKNR